MPSPESRQPATTPSKIRLEGATYASALDNSDQSESKISAVAYNRCYQLDRSKNSIYNLTSPDKAAKNLHFGILAIPKSLVTIKKDVGDEDTYARRQLALAAAQGNSINGSFKKSYTTKGTTRYKLAENKTLDFVVPTNALKNLESQLNNKQKLVLVLYDDRDGNGIYSHGTNPDTIVGASTAIPNTYTPPPRGGSDGFSVGISTSSSPKYKFQISNYLFVAAKDRDCGGLSSDDPDLGKACKEKCDLNASPLVVDLEGDGFALTSVENGVTFDIDADGSDDQVSWLAKGSDDALVVYDRNGNGKIDDGSELFGTSTPLRSGSSPANGFIPLMEFDSDDNQSIDKYDARARDLKLWIDKNHNGKSERRELTPLFNRVTSISLEFKPTLKEDTNGNKVMAESTCKTNLGESRSIVDIWFATK